MKIEPMGFNCITIKYKILFVLIQLDSDLIVVFQFLI